MLGRSSSPVDSSYTLVTDELPAISVDEALERIGIGPFHLLLLAICGTGIAADGMQKSGMMYINQGAAHEWGVEGEELGVLGSASGMGQALGALAFGRLSDVRGRRFALLCSTGLTFLLGCCCAFIQDYKLFVLSRFAVNLGLGGALPCAFTLLMEFIPIERRPRWSPALYATFGVGRFLSAIAADAFMEVSWRYYLLVIATPSAGVLLLRRWLPETPQFLVGQGELKAANEMLHRVAAMNGAASPIGPHTDLREVRVDSAETSLKAIFTGATARLLCFIWLLLALGYEWANWALRIFMSSGVPEISALQALVTFNACELVVPLLIMLLPAPAIARHTSFVVGASCLMSASLLAAFVMAIVSKWPDSVILGLGVLSVYTGTCVWVLLYIVTPSYFPAKVRGTSFGVCMAANRVGYCVGPLIAARLIESSCVLPVMMCAACYLLNGMCVFLLAKQEA